MATLPPFTEEGLLPAGDYELSLAQLKRSLLVHELGETRHSATWDPTTLETNWSSLRLSGSLDGTVSPRVSSRSGDEP